MLLVYRGRSYAKAKEIANNMDIMEYQFLYKSLFYNADDGEWWVVVHNSDKLITNFDIRLHRRAPIGGIIPRIGLVKRWWESRPKEGVDDDYWGD